MRKVVISNLVSISFVLGSMGFCHIASAEEIVRQMIVCQESYASSISAVQTQINSLLNPGGDRLVKHQDGALSIILGKQDGVCESRVSSQSIASSQNEYGRRISEKLCVTVDSTCTEEHFLNERNKIAWQENEAKKKMHEEALAKEKEMHEENQLAEKNIKKQSRKTHYFKLF
jgi:hypothetical protein